MAHIIDVGETENFGYSSITLVGGVKIILSQTLQSVCTLIERTGETIAR